jgi:uncharacterized membrane protein YgdD (TMEM256/DUF423 family)
MSDGSADRRFGFLMAGTLAALAVHAMFRHRSHGLVTAWSVAALLSTGIALLCPSLFAMPHRAWLRIGAWIGSVVSPVVMGTLYFVLLTPIGLLARLRGRDELRLKRPPAGSVWRLREPTGPTPESLKHPF